MHPGQLQGTVEPRRPLQVTCLGEALLEVDVRQLAQQAVEPMLLPLQVQLLAVVVAPADPGLQHPAVMTQPALEARPDLRERRRTVDLGLADVRQLAAERRQLWPSPGPHETLEVVHFTALAGNQACADFNDFHLCNRPTTLVGGGLQVDHQPMAHTRLPCRSA
ncbi:hypothetical protein D3C71_1627690 [compost metagenome]